MKTVAILQPNYIPWKGYFDIIAHVDEFILLDDVQYTTRDWRNRNKIKTPKGVEWLSIPVGNDTGRLIRDVEVNDASWAARHWKTIESNYKRSPCYEEISALIGPLYLNLTSVLLSEINRTFVDAICKYIGVKTKITRSSDYKLCEGKTERLVSLCEQAGADIYLSGPAAKSYIVERLFSEKKIKLNWFKYDGYRRYPQLWGDFVHEVSILDLMFNCGRASSDFMKFTNEPEKDVNRRRGEGF